MIYLKRTLWLLGYPIMLILGVVVLILGLFLDGIGLPFFYIKAGDIKEAPEYWCICGNLLGWYNGIEPKKDYEKNKV